MWIDIQRLLGVIIIAFCFPSTLLTHIHLYKGVPKGICNKIQFLTLPDTGRKTVLFPGSLCGKREELGIEITCSFVLEELQGIIGMAILYKGRGSSEWGKIWKKLWMAFWSMVLLFYSNINILYSFYHILCCHKMELIHVRRLSQIGV